MGSSSSKSTVESSSSSSQNGRRNRLIGGSSRSFQCSCLGQSSGSYDNDNDDEVSYGRKKEIRSLSREISCLERTRTGSNQVKHGRKDKVRNNANEVPSINNGVDVDCHDWDGDNVSRNDSRADNSYSEVTSNRSLAPSDRSRSRFSFFPGSISFRLSRAASLGSSSAYSLFPNGLRDSHTEEGFPANTGLTTSSINGNGTHLSRDLLPVCGINRLPVPQYEETTSSSGPQLENPDSRPRVHLQNDEIISTRDNENDRFPADQNGLRSLADIENTEARRPDRRVRAREPVERSVRFSRTLSVGRLRDRVLRRSSFSEALFGRLQDDRETRDSSQDNRGQVWGGMARSADLNGSAETMQASSNYPTSSELNSMYNGQNYDVENPRSRDGRYQDIVERRTDFLERRRRIRSQVRALQRLGSRFENLSGHERSCILSGQHRTGRCTCRTTNRATNPDDDTNARASISRIVMLAEALFEVLDEIHQQSVVLSSRPSVSSIGSVPAPKEVVESMPVKIFKKSQKCQNEDAAQCYICLVEYEEGDSVRILPCHHEFHQMCIDKWLKEIHRVCPLCRGDVCRTNSLATEN